MCFYPMIWSRRIKHWKTILRLLLFKYLQEKQKNVGFSLLVSSVYFLQRLPHNLQITGSPESAKSNCQFGFIL